MVIENIRCPSLCLSLKQNYTDVPSLPALEPRLEAALPPKKVRFVFLRETLCESGRWIDALKKRGRVLKKRGRVLKKRRRFLRRAI